MTRVFRSCIALLVLLSHAVLTVATAAEAWQGPSASPHVELGGTQRHYAHDAATCTACTVQSLHARVEAVIPPPPVRIVRVSARTTAGPRIVMSTAAVANASRAPPATS